MNDCWKQEHCNPVPKCIDNCPWYQTLIPETIKICYNCYEYDAICKSLGRQPNESCGGVRMKGSG